MKGPAPPPQLQLAQLAREHGVPGCRVQGAGCRVKGCSRVQGLQPGAGGCSLGAGVAAHRLASSTRGSRSHLLMTTWNLTLASRSRKSRNSRSEPAYG